MCWYKKNDLTFLLNHSDTEIYIQRIKLKAKNHRIHSEAAELQIIAYIRVCNLLIATKRYTMRTHTSCASGLCTLHTITVSVPHTATVKKVSKLIYHFICDCGDSLHTRNT